MTATPPFEGTAPQLATARLMLRGIRPDDLHVVHQGLSDREVTRYYDVHFATLDQARQQMRWFARNERNGSGRWWAICDQRNPRDYSPMIGACGMNAHEVEGSWAEIGYWLLPSYWGHGFASEAVPAMLEHARGIKGLTQLLARVDAPNVKSIALLERCGFVASTPAVRDHVPLDDEERLFQLAL
jgi:ribosomal-protein-alanine N-acetyltransferase